MTTRIIIPKAVACAMAFVAFWGCAPQTTPPEANWGPTMPVRAGATETALLLQDWLMPGQDVGLWCTTWSLAPTSTWTWNDKGATLPSPPASGLGHVAFKLEKPRFDVPVLGKGERATPPGGVCARTRSTSQHVQFVGDATGMDAPRRHVAGGRNLELRLGALARQPPIPMGCGWRMATGQPQPHHHVQRHGWSEFRVGGRHPCGADLECKGPGFQGVLVDGRSCHVARDDGQRRGAFRDHDDAVVLPLSLEGDAVGRRHLRAWAAHDGGISQDLLLPIEGNEVVTEVGQLDRSDWHTATMYFLMVDRFVDGESSNNEPVEDAAIRPEANHQGGDLQGVEQRLRSGYFQDLGLNTVWISPVTQNAEGAWGCGKTAPGPTSPANSAGTMAIGP